MSRPASKAFLSALAKSRHTTPTGVSAAQAKDVTLSCATHGVDCPCGGGLSNRTCINCGRVDCSVGRQAWRCDPCHRAVESALASRKKIEARRRGIE